MKQPKTKLIIDSREQKPLEFRQGIFDEIEVKGMPFADYWLEVEGKEVPIMFERKGFPDLFGTMGTGYDRFKAEMQRAKQVECHLFLLIEGSMQEVWQGYEHSSITGDSMLKKLAMLRVRYDLEVHFFNSRREMARFIEEIFSAVTRNWVKDSSLSPPLP